MTGIPTLSGLTKPMSRRKIANLPNSLTLLRIGLTPLFLVMLFAEAWYAKGGAFLIFAAASLTDFYDGRLARAGNQVTTVGRFLDPLADKILVTSALIAFVLERLVSLWLVVPIVVRDVLITGLRLYGLAHGRQMVTSRFAKWKTAAQLFSVVLLLFLVGMMESVHHFRPGIGQAAAREHIELLASFLMAGVLVLTVLSGLQYFMSPNFFRDSS